MIGYIKGKVEIILDKSVIVDNNGIGIVIKVSNKTKLSLNKGDDVKLYTHMAVKEDDISLYGFFTLEEISMYNLLISVSGVGGKVALALNDMFTPSELMLAILTDDFNLLSKASGVGKKTAQRIALELKDKIKSQENYVVESTDDTNTIKQDAIDALIALGYEKGESVKVVMETKLETVEEIIKESLKKLLKF